MCDQQSFLAHVGDVLLSSLNYDATLQAIAQLAVHSLADWCLVEVLNEHGQCLQTIAMHADPVKQPLLDRLRQMDDVKRRSCSFSIDVLNSRRSRLIAEVSGDAIAEITDQRESVSLLQELGTGSALIVPLLARGALVGTIALAHRRPNFYDVRLVEFVEQFAARAAHALENARLLRSAQDANRAKDEFLATISHELRQPLAACVAALTMMKTRKDRATGEHARTVLERQITQMTRLVEDLLDAARVVRGHVVLRPQLVDLAEIVQQAIDTVRPIVVARNQHLVLEVPPTPLQANADPVRLQQIFVNVISNAAKYSDRDGCIRVRVSNDGNALISVQDSGRGIPPQDLPRIFDLFVRASGEHESGFGVGLAVARTLIEQHGGTIEARSEGSGKGSEFIIRLPGA